MCDKDLAKLSGELSGADCLKSLVLLVVPSTCSESSFGIVHVNFSFGVPFFRTVCNRAGSI